MPTISERFQAETGRKKEPVETCNHPDAATLFTLAFDLYNAGDVRSSVIDSMEKSLPGNCLFFLAREEGYIHPENFELLPIDVIRETIKNDNACIFRQQMYINRKINELGYTLFCASLGNDVQGNEVAGGVVYSNNWNWSGVNEEKLYGFLGAVRRFYDAFSGSRVISEFAGNKSAFRYVVDLSTGDIIMHSVPKGGEGISETEINRQVSEYLIPAIIFNDDKGKADELTKQYFKNLQISKLNLPELECVLLTFQPRIPEMSMSDRNDRLIGNFSRRLTGKLGAIQNAAEKLSLREGHVVNKDDIALLAIIDSALQGSVRLVSRLSQYAHSHSQKSDDIDLNALIQDTVRDRLASMESHPRVKLILESETSFFTGDMQQFKMAVEELVVNALEACPPSGEISVTTLSGDEDISVCIQNELTPEARISAAVAAPDPVRPFISWKSGHAGMGLAIAERIITDHEGELILESDPDDIFKATLTLPVRNKTV